MENLFIGKVIKENLLERLELCILIQPQMGGVEFIKLTLQEKQPLIFLPIKLVKVFMEDGYLIVK